MFPELIELLLIGCSIESILTLRFKSNTSTPRTNLHTSWQRGISHVMNGIICWLCFISAILAPQLASLRWRNELNKNQSRTCHSQITTQMNLTARTPSFVSSSASSNPGRTSYGYQDPERYVLDDRAGQPVETSRSDYLQKDYGRSWSSQEWKSGDGEHDRSGQLDKNSWDSLGKVDPHRGEHLLGRTAPSARYEETIHDRTVQLVSENLQGKAHFENFIMGSEGNRICE